MLNGKSILFEAGDGIGDLIVVTPALRKLKELYPDVKLCFATFGNCLEIISRLPYLDHAYFMCNDLVGRMKSLKYLYGQDYVIFSSYQPALIRFAYAMGITHRVGVCKEKHKNSKLWTVKFPMSRNIKDDVFMPNYVANQLQQALGVELPISQQCDVSLPNDSEEQRAWDLLATAGKDLSIKYAIIAPLSNGGISLSHDILLQGMRKIISRGYDCVILNSKSNPLITQTVKEIGSNVYDLSGKTNLMDTVSLSKNAAFGFTVDTGIMHILCALRKYTVSVFTSGIVDWWAPKKYCLPITVDLPCRPCKKTQKCTKKTCINDIAINDVLNKIDTLIDSLNDT